MELRKIVVVQEVVHQDQHINLAEPLTRVVAAAAVTNPYANTHSVDLSRIVEIGAALGTRLAELAVERLGGPDEAQSFGKSAIVGLHGELEHAAALLHPEFGQSVRRVLQGGKSMIPSSKKLGGPGTTVDVPLGHREAAYVRSHFDAVEFRIQDAPRHDELVAILAMTDGGRPLARVGGLTAEEIRGEDGLR